MIFRFVFLVLGLVVFWGGCSGPEQVTKTTPEPSMELAEVETFDPSPYEVKAPEQKPSVTFEHRVPSALMNPSTAGLDSARTLTVRSGYRIQIFSGEAKASADEQYNKAFAWKNQAVNQPEDSVQVAEGVKGLSEELRIHIEYQAPYYKVRIGDFLNREQAEKALPVVQKRFEDAWVVPDQVEIYE